MSHTFHYRRGIIKNHYGHRNTRATISPSMQENRQVLSEHTSTCQLAPQQSRVALQLKKAVGVSELSKNHWRTAIRRPEQYLLRIAPNPIHTRRSNPSPNTQAQPPKTNHPSPTTQDQPPKTNHPRPTTQDQPPKTNHPRPKPQPALRVSPKKLSECRTDRKIPSAPPWKTRSQRPPAGLSA